MCGIFGIVLAEGSRASSRDWHHDLGLLFRLSGKRGSDATGLAVHDGGRIQVLRRGGDAGRMLRDPRFATTMEQALAASGSGPLAAIGHCRLVTHGSMGIEENNQPLCVDFLVGLHNGIVTNTAELMAPGPGPAASTESWRSESDTRQLYRRIAEHYRTAGSLQSAVALTYGELRGSASIAALRSDVAELWLATNTGSLHLVEAPDPAMLVFASERSFLQQFVHRSRLLGRRPAGPITQLAARSGLSTDLGLRHPERFDLTVATPAPTRPESAPPGRSATVVAVQSDIGSLRRCTRCVLPQTYPFIEFDERGVCNYCRRHIKQQVHGPEALERWLARYRSTDGRPDCLFGLSGGRDSCYGLHLLVREFGMTPICYTYDWGLTTDTSRRNQALMCGRLGLEHVIRSPDIAGKRRNIRQNIHAWLARPHLGMVPLFMAGDKDFYHYGRALRRELGLELTVFCAGHPLEQREFFLGFCGVDENIQNNKRCYSYTRIAKIKLALFYAGQYLRNPRYLNASLFDSIRSFFTTFVARDDFLYLYEYIQWDERRHHQVLDEVYGWQADQSYGKLQWRMGDGQTAFTNYIFYQVAGFSEFDQYRSNQIREGFITRAEALERIAEDNRPKYETLEYFAYLVGINLDEVLRAVNQIPKLY